MMQRSYGVNGLTPHLHPYGLNPTGYCLRYRAMPSPPPACPLPRWQLLKQALTNVGPTAFDRLRATAAPGTLLDVRRPEEYGNHHLEGAVNLNYLGPDFLEEIEALDPGQTYLVYCRSGRRSVRACTLMRNAGLHHRIHLDGGINAYGA